MRCGQQLFFDRVVLEVENRDDRHVVAQAIPEGSAVECDINSGIGGGKQDAVAVSW